MLHVIIKEQDESNKDYSAHYNCSNDVEEKLLQHKQSIE
jgi:hypothetical protein